MTDKSEPPSDMPPGFETTEEILQKAIQFLKIDMKLEITYSFPAYVKLGELGDYRIRLGDDETCKLERVDMAEEVERFNRNREGRAHPFTFELVDFLQTRTIPFSYYPGGLAGYSSWIKVGSNGEMTRGEIVLS